MASRESAQPPTHTSELPYKSVSFTEKSVGPTIDAAPSVGSQPELLVSRPTLTFEQRTGDKPVFSILTIAQKNADTPVTLSTDDPDHFQLASDSRPAFGSTLTFIPPPAGSYVHLRYMASKGNSHHAQLIIETPYTSTTVALEGRRKSTLSVVRTILPATNRVPEQQPDRATSGSRWAALLATVAVVGLVYTAYTYQCQLSPSLCREKTTESVQLKTPAPFPRSTTNRLSPTTKIKERSNKRKAKGNKTSTLRFSSQHRPVASTEKSSDNQSDEPRRVIRNRTSRTVTDQENIESKVRSRVRRQKDATRIKESDLERELNKDL